ncbi:GntR family transcriptional regulator [Bacillus sp. J14TS2]|uniref:FadR/GntR family transcriptional regulator n=1 Tax=Bacillus sp. J14TS2 TaxID=2807188 RepID=UPI001B14F087|nr:FadR/GntR family transcriptional regulator [Bacillus sp. J14TS2]GIN69944.1 GntR family transcriptional regulator [Bacillus sp. J14TS2]
MAQRKQTLSEIVIERIKTHIAENQYQSGDQLPSEKEIIQMLGVSRTAVREALKSLQSQGIIEIKPGVGIFVTKVHLQSYLKNISPFLAFDQIKFKDLIDARIILELGAIELAIDHYHIDEINQMEKWNNLILEKAQKGEKPKEEDRLFHKTLFNATGNETYIQLSYIINEYFQANQLEEVVDMEEYKHSYEEHKQVIDAIQQKDKETAQQAMRNHLSHLYNLLHGTE